MAVSPAYKILWAASMVFVILPHLNLGLLSDYKICGDSECESLMSRVRAIRDYHGKDCRFLNFRQGETIFVYHKLTGKRNNLWAGSIDKQFGHFPKDAVKEEHVYNTGEKVVEAQESDFFCMDEYGSRIDIVDDDDVDEDDQKIQNQDSETTQTLPFTDDLIEESPPTSADPFKEPQVSSQEAEGGSIKVDARESTGTQEEAQEAPNKQGGSAPSGWLGSSMTGWLGLSKEEEPGNVAEEGVKQDKIIESQDEASYTSSVTGWLGLSKEKEPGNEAEEEEKKDEIIQLQGEDSYASSMTGWLGFGGEGQKPDEALTIVEEGETADSIRSTMSGWLGFGDGKETAQPPPDKERGEELGESNEEKEPAETFRSRRMSLDLEGSQLHEEETEETGTLGWLGNGLSNTLGFGLTNQESKAEETIPKEEEPPKPSSWLDIGIGDMLGFKKDRTDESESTRSGFKETEEDKTLEQPTENVDSNQSQPVLTEKERTEASNEPKEEETPKEYSVLPEDAASMLDSFFQKRNEVEMEVEEVEELEDHLLDDGKKEVNVHGEGRSVEMESEDHQTPKSTEDDGVDSNIEQGEEGFQTARDSDQDLLTQSNINYRPDLTSVDLDSNSEGFSEGGASEPLLSFEESKEPTSHSVDVDDKDSWAAIDNNTFTETREGELGQGEEVDPIEENSQELRSSQSTSGSSEIWSEKASAETVGSETKEVDETKQREAEEEKQEESEEIKEEQKQEEIKALKEEEKKKEVEEMEEQKQEEAELKEEEKKKEVEDVKEVEKKEEVEDVKEVGKKEEVEEEKKEEVKEVDEEDKTEEIEEVKEVEKEEEEVNEEQKKEEETTELKEQEEKNEGEDVKEEEKKEEEEEVDEEEKEEEIEEVKAVEKKEEVEELREEEKKGEEVEVNGVEHKEEVAELKEEEKQEEFQELKEEEKKEEVDELKEKQRQEEDKVIEEKQEDVEEVKEDVEMEESKEVKQVKEKEGEEEGSFHFEAGTKNTDRPESESNDRETEDENSLKPTQTEKTEREEENKKQEEVEEVKDQLKEEEAEVNEEEESLKCSNGLCPKASEEAVVRDKSDAADRLSSVDAGAIAAGRQTGNEDVNSNNVNGIFDNIDLSDDNLLHQADTTTPGDTETSSLGIPTEKEIEQTHSDHKTDTEENTDREEVKIGLKHGHDLRLIEDDDVQVTESDQNTVGSEVWSVGGIKVSFSPPEPVESEAVISEETVQPVSYHPTGSSLLPDGPSKGTAEPESGGAFGLFRNPFGFFSQEPATEAEESKESAQSLDSNTGEASLTPEPEPELTIDPSWAHTQDLHTDSPIALAQQQQQQPSTPPIQTTSPSPTQTHPYPSSQSPSTESPVRAKNLSKHYKNLLAHMSADDANILLDLFGRHKLQFLDYILGRSETTTDDEDESILLDVERLLHYHREALSAPNARLANAPQEDKEKTRALIALQKLEMLLERVRETFTTGKSDFSNKIHQGLDTNAPGDKWTGVDGKERLTDRDKGGGKEKRNKGETVPPVSQRGRPWPVAGVTKQMLDFVHQIAVDSATHVHAARQLLIWLTVQVEVVLSKVAPLLVTSEGEMNLTWVLEDRFSEKWMWRKRERVAFSNTLEVSSSVNIEKLHLKSEFCKLDLPIGYTVAMTLNLGHLDLSLPLAFSIALHASQLSSLLHQHHSHSLVLVGLLHASSQLAFSTCPKGKLL